MSKQQESQHIVVEGPTGRGRTRRAIPPGVLANEEFVAALREGKFGTWQPEEVCGHSERARLAEMIEGWHVAVTKPQYTLILRDSRGRDRCFDMNTEIEQVEV